MLDGLNAQDTTEISPGTTIESCAPENRYTLSEAMYFVESIVPVNAVENVTDTNSSTEIKSGSVMQALKATSRFPCAHQ